MSTTCTKCQKEFKSEAFLKRHLKNKYPCDKPLQCDICKKVFKSVSGVINHKNKKKPCVAPVEVEVSTTKVQCSYCKGLYATKSSMTRHLSVCKIKNSPVENIIKTQDAKEEILKQQLKQKDDQLNDARSRMHAMHRQQKSQPEQAPTGNSGQLPPQRTNTNSPLPPQLTSSNSPLQPNPKSPSKSKPNDKNDELYELSDVTPYKLPNVNYITGKWMLGLIENVSIIDVYINLLNKIYFNSSHPENHNIRIPVRNYGEKVVGVIRTPEGRQWGILEIDRLARIVATTIQGIIITKAAIPYLWDKEVTEDTKKIVELTGKVLCEYEDPKHHVIDAMKEVILSNTKKLFRIYYQSPLDQISVTFDIQRAREQYKKDKELAESKTKPTPTPTSKTKPTPTSKSTSKPTPTSKPTSTSKSKPKKVPRKYSEYQKILDKRYGGRIPTIEEECKFYNIDPVDEYAKEKLSDAKELDAAKHENDVSADGAQEEFILDPKDFDNITV